jgi:hypothetical protein
VVLLRFASPPAPRVTALPLIENEPAVESKLSELMLHGVLTTGDNPFEPSINRFAVPSFEGAATGFQFNGVLQLLSAPPPVQVDVEPELPLADETANVGIARSAARRMVPDEENRVFALVISHSLFKTCNQPNICRVGPTKLHHTMIPLGCNAPIHRILSPRNAPLLPILAYWECNWMD